MKLKVWIVVCTASLFVAFPILAQRQDGEHGHHGDRGHHGNNSNHSGNNSNHSGHDDDGNSAEHRQDAPHGFGDLVLESAAQVAAVSTEVTSVVSALSSRSLTTLSGASIPTSAQASTYALLTADPAQPAFTGGVSTALSTAGPVAAAMVPSLVYRLSGLSSYPAYLPSVVAQYNDFTKAASSEFIAKPPPEFVAVYAVLAKLTAAADGAK